MRILLGLLIISLSSAPVSAETIGTGSNSTPAPNYSSGALCAERYQRNGCGEYFSAHPDLAQYGIDCTQPENALNELLSCGEGAVKSVEDLIKGIAGIPMAFWSVFQITPERELEIQFWHECAQITECKVQMWTAANGGVAPDPEMLARLEEVKSGNLIEHSVKTSIYLQESANRDKALELLRTTPDTPERDAAIEQLIPGWTEQKNRQELPLIEMGLSAAEDFLTKARCYKPEIQLEAVCYGLTTIFAPGAVVGAAGKLSRLAGVMGEIALGSRIAGAGAALVGTVEELAVIRQAESLLGRTLSVEQRTAVLNAHAIGAGEIGADGTLAGIGNYTTAQNIQKGVILRHSGFTADETRALMENGVTGYIRPGVPRPNRYYDASDAIEIDGLSDAQRIQFNQLLDRAVPEGQGGARQYYETPQGLANVTSWGTTRYDFSDLATRFFSHSKPTDLKFEIPGAAPGRALDKVRITSPSDPGRLIEIDPAAGYFRVYDRGQSMRVSELPGGSLYFEPSNNASQTHLLLSLGI